MKNIFKEIQQYRMKNKLVMFVGAGVSRVSNYPSWNKLVEVMAKQLQHPYIKNDKNEAVFSSDELLKIPQKYYDVFGPKQYNKIVRDEFSGNYLINKVHHNIMRLQPQHLITTNYDTLLETAATKFGINYSVINGDENVSHAETQRYILKVHGDFQAKKFVLKEEDYLNYSNDFKLIDNVMKTLLATNLVIFIGYGLNDVNIKTIINWVKSVQGKTYIEPIFINTDKKTESYDKKYYKKRKIRIIDACKYYLGNDYEKKYCAVLEKILNYNPTNNVNAINYLYSLTFEWNQFGYMRNTHIKQLLNMNYCFDYGNNLFNDSNNQVDFFEQLYNPQGKFTSEEIDRKKIIIENLKSTNIKDIVSKYRLYEESPHYKISSKYFKGNYREINEKVKYLLTNNNASLTSEELYDVANDMFICGYYIKSYEFYTKSIDLFSKEKKWIKYYFSQINRYLVYKFMILINNETSGIQGDMRYGRHRDLFNDEKSIGIFQDMKGFNYNDLFNQLPGHIKNKYTFLRDYCTNNIYSNDITNMSDLLYNIKIKISEKKITILGLSEYEKLISYTIDALKFTYDNGLLFYQFSEHNSYIRSAITAYLEGKRADYNLTKNYKKIAIDAQMLVLINKNFDTNSIKYLLNSVEINEFIWKDEVKDEEYYTNYINRLIDYYKEYLYVSLNDPAKLSMSLMLEQEYINICLISYSFLNNNNDKKNMINFILNYMPDNSLNYQEKIHCLKTYHTNELTDDIIIMLDDLICKSIKEITISSHVLSCGKHICNYLYSCCNYIIELNKEYISKNLSNIVLESVYEEDIFIEFLLKFKDILSEKALDKLK